ncbi:MAG TPA: ergothioneine biosynthesis protein EgtC [Vulgatibacter sp.]
MIGYLGDPRPLGSLVSEPPHSLVRQSWEPRETRSAKVNADGWGAGFFLDGDPEPCLYRSTLPIWADVNVPHLGRAVRAGCFVAAVRSATEPTSVSQANTQPFASGRIAFLHNGFVERFRERVRRRLCADLGDDRFGGIAGTSDSEHLFALMLDRLDREEPGRPDALARAAAAAVTRVQGWAAEAGASACFSLLLADGDSLIALRSAVGCDAPSLYVRDESGSVVFASERLDDGSGWRAVEEGRILIARRGAPLREERLEGAHL